MGVATTTTAGRHVPVRLRELGLGADGRPTGAPAAARSLPPRAVRALFARADVAARVKRGGLLPEWVLVDAGAQLGLPARPGATRMRNRGRLPDHLVDRPLLAWFDPVIKRFLVMVPGRTPTIPDAFYWVSAARVTRGADEPSASGPEWGWP